MKKTAASILVIDDDTDILLSAKLYLSHHFEKVETLNDPSSLNTLLSKNDFDVIMLDMNFRKGNNDGKEGMYWLEHIVSVEKEISIIMMTAYGEVEMAVEALKKGAFDFILKPWKNEKLLATISAAYRHRKSRRKVSKLQSLQTSHAANTAQKIIGDSPALNSLLNAISKVAATDANILILGENGTGKQVFAREIHVQSDRAAESFIHVDLGALTENLFESELFGHAKGAFTDAKEDKAGRFELADGGTIFLDEIGNLSYPLQAKLLTVLENRKVSRLGESKERKVNFRLLCATNMSLEEMVKKGEFRQDLYYRINTVELKLPPLRERPTDIPLLVNHFLRTYSRKYRKDKLKLSQDAMKAMQKANWLGNIRELQHTIERLVIMSEGTEITTEFLNLPTAAAPKTDDLETLNLEELEKMAIVKSLEKHKGNISNTAKELGLTRAALYRRMEKYEL